MRGDAFIHFVSGSRRVNIRLGVLLLIAKSPQITTFSKRWVNAASLVVRKGAMLESSFPPLPAHGVYGTGPLGPHSE